MTVPVGMTYQVISVSVNLNIAPTTSEDLTITINSISGSAYDILVYSLDLAAGSTTDLLWQPDEDLYLVGGDSLDVDYTNTDGNTFGSIVTVVAV